MTNPVYIITVTLDDVKRILPYTHTRLSDNELYYVESRIPYLIPLKDEDSLHVWTNTYIVEGRRIEIHSGFGNTGHCGFELKTNNWVVDGNTFVHI